MTGVLKVGIVGAGVFAGYHAGKVTAHPRASLCGVFDPDSIRADAFAKTHHCPIVEDLKALADICDALIIAIPASYHADAAKTGLAANCHILIEKPLATVVSDCEDLVERAGQGGRVLQIGHQERVVLKAIGLDRIQDRPKRIEIIRHTGRTERNLDTSVVFDLMIHDIDLLIALYGPPDTVCDVKGHRIYSDQWDAVFADISFGDISVTLSASRDTDPSRTWRLGYATGDVVIDFGQKTLRHRTGFDLNPDFGDDPRVQDSLATAFDYFVRACLDGTPPLASGQDGMAAVRVATDIQGIL